MDTTAMYTMNKDRAFIETMVNTELRRIKCMKKQPYILTKKKKGKSVQNLIVIFKC